MILFLRNVRKQKHSTFKKEIQIEAKKYRPNSLLPSISKTIEKSILDQIHDYLQRNKLLYTYQSGFRANHSKKTCLSCLTDMTLIYAENGKQNGMILTDLQQAFDSLNHKILLDKMTCLGFLD